MKTVKGKLLDKKKKDKNMLYGTKTKKDKLKENKEYKEKMLNE